MIQYINYHPQFEKQCERLKRSNDKAIKALENALDILLAFKRSRKNFSCVGALTHYGELRLKSGIKYRLGNGYRLVLSIREDTLFVLCIGSHDQCDQWLERNRGKEDFDYFCQEKIFIGQMGENKALLPGFPDIKVERFPHIKDRTLRKIFPGICHSRI